MAQKIQFSLLIPGNLGQVRERGGTFWHLTWKQNGKTVSRYIRLDEVNRVRKGVKAYARAKEVLKNTAETNLQRLFKERKAK